MKEYGKLIEGTMRDARFQNGPIDGQVRPVILGAMVYKLAIGDVVHRYHNKRTIARWDGTVLGFVFRYAGVE